MLLGLACEQGTTGDAAALCDVGELRRCAGSDGCEGRRLCEGPVGRWGECACQSPPDDPQVDAGVTAAARLGAACGGDGECPVGAWCATVKDDVLFGGAPVANTCVADCAPGGEQCERFDAVCVDLSVNSPAAEPLSDEDVDAGVGDGGMDDAGSRVATARSLCLERCAIGGDPGRCHGRVELACQALAPDAGDGYCRPLCAADGECPSDRVCDPASGACARSRAADYRIGRSCGLDADAACGGTCARVAASEPVCSAPCVFGNPGECGLGANGAVGGCLLTTPGGGLGDVGYCAELCDCDLDCSHPSAICDGFASDTLRMVFGRAGACVAPTLAVGEALSCP